MHTYGEIENFWFILTHPPYFERPQSPQGYGRKVLELSDSHVSCSSCPKSHTCALDLSGIKSRSLSPRRMHAITRLNWKQLFAMPSFQHLCNGRLKQSTD